MDDIKHAITANMKLLQGWNWMRILRLSLSIALLVQGFMARDAIAIILGLTLGGMAVANLSCCGINGCAVNNTSTNKNISMKNEDLVIKK